MLPEALGQDVSSKFCRALKIFAEIENFPVLLFKVSSQSGAMDAKNY
jgi:hypothetical protein